MNTITLSSTGQHWTVTPGFADEESVMDFTQLSDQTLVFTDGSCTNGLIGASAVLYIDYNHIATLRHHLGGAEHHTVFEAEAVGLILAAH